MARELALPIFFIRHQQHLYRTRQAAGDSRSTHSANIICTMPALHVENTRPVKPPVLARAMASCPVFPARTRCRNAPAAVPACGDRSGEVHLQMIAGLGLPMDLNVAAQM